MNVDLDTAEIAFLSRLVEHRQAELRRALELATNPRLIDHGLARTAVPFDADRAKELRQCVAVAAKLNGALHPQRSTRETT
jgi:hypothetical protein